MISAEVAYDRAAKALAALRSPEDSDIAAARNEVKNAEAALSAAQESLDALRAGGSEARMQAAANALLIARNRYHDERQRIKDEIDRLYEELEDAEEALDEANEDDEEYDNSFTESALEDAQEVYDEAKEAVDEEVPKLVEQLLPNPPTGTDAGELLGAWREAQHSYDSASVSVTDDQRAAERSVESAVRTLAAAQDKLGALLNPSPEDIRRCRKRGAKRPVEPGKRPAQADGASGWAEERGRGKSAQRTGTEAPGPAG